MIDNPLLHIAMRCNEYADAGYDILKDDGSVLFEMVADIAEKFGEGESE